MAGLLQQSLDHLQFDRYMSVAGSMIWVHDYILTIGDEVTLIWPRKMSLVKFLYFANRYVSAPYIALLMYYFLGTVQGTVSERKNVYVSGSSHLFAFAGIGNALLTHPSPDRCLFINIAIILLRQVEVLSGTWLITIRVLVLYARNKWIRWTLYAAFIITHGVTLGMMGNVIYVIIPKMTYVVQLRLCVSTTPEVTKYLYFIQIPFEILLLIFLLFHSWQFNRTVVMPVNVKRNPLLQALYTDGVLYFVGTIASRVWAGCVILFLDSTFWYMTIVMDVCLSSVFISRIFLHLSVVSESTTTTLAATSFNAAPISTKHSMQLHVYPPSQGYAEGSDTMRSGTSGKLGANSAGRARISWTELGRPERVQQNRKKYDSIMEDP